MSGRKLTKTGTFYLPKRRRARTAEVLEAAIGSVHQVFIVHERNIELPSIFIGKSDPVYRET